MKSTKYSSYVSGKLPVGCELCVKGRKMVLFVTGLCSRGCEFCPLSKLRKNVDKIYANECEVKNFEEIVKEIKNSGAKGCSITGGDPLLKFDRTLDLAKKLKKMFGKKFHIHIYLSTRLVTEEKLKKLSEFIDEVRFHPDFEKPLKEELSKIKTATKFFKRKNVGIEIPMFPDKIEKIYELILNAQKFISFLNLNELETGEFSDERMRKKYSLNADGHTIRNSISAGKKLIDKIEKAKIKLNVHLCTAELKNNFQFGNRLKNYKKLKFSKKTKDGTIIYLATETKNKNFLNRGDFFADEQKNQLILNPNVVQRIRTKIKIFRVEEYPTFDREEILREEI